MRVTARMLWAKLVKQFNPKTKIFGASALIAKLVGGA